MGSRRQTAVDAAGIQGSPDDTRTRLLKAAAEVFAEHGFESATIRQICRRADANVALVNYHFGDKLELYTEVLRLSLHTKETPMPAPPTVDVAPAVALRQIVSAMVERAFEGDRADLRFRLMMNEFMRPSPATARVVDIVLRPVYERLREIAGKVLDLPPDDETTRLCVHSILAQVGHFAHSGQMLALLWPQMKMTPPQREQVAHHITAFTMAYLELRRAHAKAAAGARATDCVRRNGRARPDVRR